MKLITNIFIKYLRRVNIFYKFYPKIIPFHSFIICEFEMFRQPIFIRILLALRNYVSTVSAGYLQNEHFQEVRFFVTRQTAFTSKCWPSKYDCWNISDLNGINKILLVTHCKYGTGTHELYLLEVYVFLCLFVCFCVCVLVDKQNNSAGVLNLHFLIVASTDCTTLHVFCLFLCLFSWRYKPLWFHFHSPVAGFSHLILEINWSHTTTSHSR